MKKIQINIPVRLKNPIFLIQLALAIATPLLAYYGLEFKDLTTWHSVGDVAVKAIQNPYVIGLMVVSVWNAINDPTVAGLSDSTSALTYTKPKENANGE